MEVIMYLLIILLALMSIIGGKRGFKSFLTLCFNFFAMYFMLVLMAAGFDPLKIAFYGCILITSATLLYINGFNRKTVASILSVIITILLTMLLAKTLGQAAKVQGVGMEETQDISNILVNLKLDFNKIFLSQILIGLLGGIMDTAMSIASSMNEIYKNNDSISRKELVKSGINIGRDILGTMTNTLLFAFVGGFMYMLIYFNIYNYPLVEILNKKIFSSQVIQIFSGGIGIVLIVPVTAFITSRILYIKRRRAA